MAIVVMVALVVSPSSFSLKISLNPVLATWSRRCSRRLQAEPCGRRRGGCRSGGSFVGAQMGVLENPGPTGALNILQVYYLNLTIIKLPN